MSTAAATATPTADVAGPKKSKKKLFTIIAAVLVLALVGGGGAAWMLKKKAATAAEVGAEEGEGEPASAQAAEKHDPKAVPTFVPLEPFTVNLADRDAERYAQVGMTLEVSDPKVADQIKTYMPAIRNNILMALADKSAAQLMDREGKSRFAAQVRRETARAMGYTVAEPPAETEAAAAKPKKKAKPEAELPITGVHFSNFIIQ